MRFMMKELYFSNNNIVNESKSILNDIEKKRTKKKIVFNPSKSALLVLDMQEYFLNEKSHAFIPTAEIILPQIVKLINFYSSHGLCVIATQHINSDEDAQMMGQWWSEIIRDENEFSKVKPGLLSSDTIIIKKTQYDSFYQTKLEELLNDRNIEQIVVTGVMTHLCCETTIRSAFVRGFKSFFPIDATATYNYDFHKASFLNLSHGFAVPVLTEDILNHFNN